MSRFPNLYNAVKLAINMTNTGGGYQPRSSAPLQSRMPAPQASFEVPRTIAKQPSAPPASGRMLGPVADDLANWRTPLRLPDLPRPVNMGGPAIPFSRGLNMSDVELANIARGIARQTQPQHGLRVGRGGFRDVAQAANFLRRNPRFMEAARQQVIKRHPALVVQD